MWNTFDATVTAEGVRYTRGDQVVLEHVDLQALPAQVTAVVGADGSGRTTLMQILGGAVRASSGTVRIAGHDPVADPVGVRALVGVVSEEISVWEFLSCTEVLDILARGHRLPSGDRTQRIAEVLRMTGLADAGDLRTEHLDLAGRRRFGLAAALLHDPPILLLDSPVCGLDPRSRQAFLQVVRDRADEGRTVVVTGTDLAGFADVADSAVTLQHGRSGPAQSLSTTGDDGRRLQSWLARSLDRDLLLTSLGRLGRPFAEYGPDGALIQLVDDRDAAGLNATLSALDVPLICLQPLTGPPAVTTPASIVGPRTAVEELR